MFGKALVVVCAAAALVRQAAAPATPDELNDKGEQILNGSCNTSCHDLRPIQVEALDKDGWRKSVAAMIEKGANVRTEEAPTLVEYLAASHGPLPDGPGKALLLNVCTVCHDLKRVLQHGATPQQWEETLQTMLNEGAPLTDQDFGVLLKYLAKHFGPPQ